jgi:hypothetical protein
MMRSPAPGMRIVEMLHERLANVIGHEGGNIGFMPGELTND